MRIFLSHSSQQKPLIREIRRYFPEHIDTWIDERNLFIGDEISQTLKTEISEKSDYMLLFLDNNAAHSDWVKKEIAWALEAEREHNRTILLVILIDQDALGKLHDTALTQRRYIKCFDLSERAIEYVANSIVADLFSLACRDLDNLNNPSAKTQIDLLRSSNDFLDIMAQQFTSLLFPYRQDNPTTRSAFFDLYSNQSNKDISERTFNEILNELFEKDMLPGISYDGQELFILEEHYKWKTQINQRMKEAVARIAARNVRSGDIIAVDAGSATDELIRVLCTKFTSRSLANVTLVTNSMSAVEMLLDAADIHGFDEHSCPFKLFLVGGFVRPNTRAIVNLEDDKSGSFMATLRKLGGADIGFVGVNGIDIDRGFTTHENKEACNKLDIISLSKKSIILGDSTKIGVIEDKAFATFDDDVSLVVDNSPISQDLCARIGKRTSQVILA